MPCRQPFSLHTRRQSANQLVRSLSLCRASCPPSPLCVLCALSTHTQHSVCTCRTRVCTNSGDHCSPPYKNHRRKPITACPDQLGYSKRAPARAAAGVWCYGEASRSLSHELLRIDHLAHSQSVRGVSGLIVFRKKGEDSGINYPVCTHVP